MNDAVPLERPTELPATWLKARLDKLGIWFGGGTPSKDNPAYWSGTLPWVSPKDMKVARIIDTEDHITEHAVRNSATSPIPAGAVLMVIRSGILRHTFPVAVAGVDVTVNQDMKALVPFDGIDSDYVAAALRAFEGDVLSQCAKDGTTVQSIEFSRLKDFQIPVAPLKEQQRIVGKIDELFSELDAGVASLERARTLLKKYRQAVLKAAVTGELTRDWRERHRGEIEESGADLLQRILKERRRAWETAELKKLRAIGKPSKDDRWKQRYKEPQPPDTTRLPALPEGWVWATFEQVTQDDARNGISVRGSDVPPGVPALKLNAIVSNSIDYTVVRYIPISEQKAAQLAVREGDLLVSRASGTLTFCGRAGIAPPPSEQTVFPDTMIRFRVVHEVLLRWLAAIWNSPLVRQEIEGKAKTSAGIWKVSQQDLGSIMFPLPSTEEQQAALDIVEVSDSSETQAYKAIRDEASRASQLRQCILKAAFAGKLVPQDPNDEPASVLLERIRAERAARPKPARGWRRKGSAVHQLELLR